MSEDVLSDAFFDARERDLKKRLKPKRFEHARGVSKTAASLAETYGVDVRKARLAGLLHDWDKEYGDDEIRERCTAPRPRPSSCARTPTCPPTWSRPSLGTRPRRWA